MADSVLGLSLDPAKAKTYEVENWTSRPDRRAAGRQRRLRHNGSATAEVDFPFPVDALYVFASWTRNALATATTPSRWWRWMAAQSGRFGGFASELHPHDVRRSGQGAAQGLGGLHQRRERSGEGRDRNLYVDKLLIASHEMRSDLVSSPRRRRSSPSASARASW